MMWTSNSRMWTPEDAPTDVSVLERRKDERRKPTINKAFAEGLAFMGVKKFTGEVTLHMHEGKPQRIVLPNPDGW